MNRMGPEHLHCRWQCMCDGSLGVRIAVSMLSIENAIMGAVEEADSSSNGCQLQALDTSSL
jgi:hypothetical protein